MSKPTSIVLLDHLESEIEARKARIMYEYSLLASHRDLRDRVRRMAVDFGYLLEVDEVDERAEKPAVIIDVTVIGIDDRSTYPDDAARVTFEFVIVDAPTNIVLEAGTRVGKIGYTNRLQLWDNRPKGNADDGK